MGFPFLAEHGPRLGPHDEQSAAFAGGDRRKRRREGLSVVDLDGSLPGAVQETCDEQVGLSFHELAVEDSAAAVGGHRGALDVEDRRARAVDHACWRERSPHQRRPHEDGGQRQRQDEQRAREPHTGALALKLEASVHRRGAQHTESPTEIDTAGGEDGAHAKPTRTALANASPEFHRTAACVRQITLRLHAASRSRASSYA